MKTVLIILSLLLSLSAHDQWIQVFTGKKVTPHFLKVVQNHGYQAIVIKEGKQEKVLIGAYISSKMANKKLKKIRCDIAEDAFVRQYSYYPQKKEIMLKAQVKEKVLEKKVECKPVACVCPKNQKHRRELEIGSALSFYKNSSHYHFETKE